MGHHTRDYQEQIQIAVEWRIWTWDHQFQIHSPKLLGHAASLCVCAAVKGMVFKQFTLA